MTIKQCIRCHEAKPVSDFYSIKTGDGYSSKCKKCSCYYQLDYKIKNEEKIKAYNKEYQKTYKRKVREKPLVEIPNGFQQIENYPDYYVSPNCEQIWSRRKNRLLAAVKINHGYLASNLFNENGRKMVLVHRVLAQAFIPNPNNLRCVNHKNGDKLDNRIENLEWVSHQQNVDHAIMLGIFVNPNKRPSTRKLTPEQALEILRNPDNLTQQQLADRYGIAKGTVSHIHQRQIWKKLEL